MTDTLNEHPTPKPAKKKATKKRKVAKRAPRAAAPPVETKPVQTYPGLTKTECAVGCSRNGCVISGNGCCGHPAKGGFSFINKNDPAALDRFAAAQKQLGIAAAEA